MFYWDDREVWLPPKGGHVASPKGLWPQRAVMWLPLKGGHVSGWPLGPNQTSSIQWTFTAARGKGVFKAHLLRMSLYLFLSFVDPHVKSYFGPLGLVVLSGARMVLAMATGSATFLSLADCWLLTLWGVSMHFGGYSPASTYAESPSVIKTNKQTN